MSSEASVMRILRQFVGTMVLPLSTVGIVCYVARIIDTWKFCLYASARVEKVSAGLDVGLQRASAAIQNVQYAVGKAHAEVGKVSKESADLAGSGEKSRRASRTLQTLIQQQVAPYIDDLGARLAT
jgi:hypothetical protein